MINKHKLYSIAVVSAAMILILISIASAAPFAYITNNGNNSAPGNTVSVIDTATNTVTTNVSVGNYPWGIVVTPDGTKAYVTNYASNNVSVINTTTYKVITNVTVGSLPRGVAITPDGTKVYAANSGSNTISVINTINNTAYASITVGNYPYGVAVTPDGSKIYVTYHGDRPGNVSVINTTNNTAYANVTVGNYPSGIAVTPDGTKVYVADYYCENTLYVIDTTNNTVIDTMNVGSDPLGIAVTPDGTKVYVTNSGDDTVSVINTANNTVIDTVNVGQWPFGVAATPDGTKVYVTNDNSNSISVIDTTSNAVTTVNIGIGIGPVAFGQFIGKSAPTITWNNPANITYGTALNGTQLDAIASVPGNFVYTPPAGTVLNVGQNQQLNTIFTPTDTINYTQAEATVYINVVPTAPALTLSKVANLTSYSIVGTVIGYNYTINNTGNVNITGITVTDNLTTVNSNPPSQLQAGQNFTGTATYTITQSDYDNSSVTNLANATGSYNGQTVSNTTTATITAISQHPTLNITKVASPSSYDHIGELITYTYTVTNTGNVDIPEPITVHDNKILGEQITIGTSGSMLAPGQNVTGTGTYAITQADLNNGSVTNSAFATGPNNIVISNNTSVTVLAIQKPNLKIDKDVDPKTYFTVGDLIDYSFTVTNKGNVDIAGPITVTDSMFGSKQISSNGLAPGQSVTRGKSYLITPQDIDAGFVVNSAFAKGSFNDKKVTSDTDKAIAKFFGPTANL
jgi:uncharacterized repeat protein (TIGR01451 family)